MTVKQLISDAEVSVHYAVAKSKVDSRTVIARYTAAIAVNFTDWIGKTIPWVRHETAYHALVDNLRCESMQDHVGMLLRFATLSGALPGREEFAHTSAEVAAIRRLFLAPAVAGLNGVMLCAVLENTSGIFIPDLARRARECGCTDFAYTDMHGEADIEHSRAFTKATAVEYTMGYSGPEFLVREAARSAVNLILRIYA